MTVRRYLADGSVVDLTGAELSAWEADQATRKIAQLPKRRESRRLLHQQQADARIALACRLPADARKEDVLTAQMRLMGGGLRAARAEGKGPNAQAKAQLDALDALFTGIEAVRAAETAANDAVAAAGLDDQMTPDQRLAEIDAVLDVDARLA
ncbi:MAG: hypothetical protein H6948_02225 [Zoogloeaceae bacterium]|nr:hypothetical protein [Zoogloeaceae bacterium]